MKYLNCKIHKHFSLAIVKTKEICLALPSTHVLAHNVVSMGTKPNNVIRKSPPAIFSRKSRST